MSRFFNFTEIFFADQTGRLGCQQSAFRGTPEIHLTLLALRSLEGEGGNPERLRFFNHQGH